MIRIVKGNLLDAKEAFIAHQVSCYGTMNAGVALQIKNKYPDVYRRYCDYCNEHSLKRLLGRVLLVPTDDGKVICNLFGQENFGYGDPYTNIDALSRAFRSLEKIVPSEDSIAMPYMIGCGLNDKTWNITYDIIIDTFKKHDVKLYYV